MTWRFHRALKMKFQACGGDMVAAKGIRYYDRSGVEKRAREEMGDL